MYCRWPPSRWGGTTIRRAILLVTSLPSSRRTRCRHASMPAAVPALVIRLPSSTNSTLRSTLAVGNRRARSSACIQWVVQGRPSNSPASPATKAPEHTVRMIAPASAAALIASSASGRYSDPAIAGIATRSAPMRLSSPLSGISDAPTEVRIGLPGSGPHTLKSKLGTPSAERSIPKTSQITPNSKTASRSSTSADTFSIAMAVSYRTLSLLPLLAVYAPVEHYCHEYSSDFPDPDCPVRGGRRTQLGRAPFRLASDPVRPVPLVRSAGRQALRGRPRRVPRRARRRRDPHPVREAAGLARFRRHRRASLGRNPRRHDRSAVPRREQDDRHRAHANTLS